MRFRQGRIALILAIVTAAAIAAAAEGQGRETAVGVASAAPVTVSSPLLTRESKRVSDDELTRPQVRPAYGQTDTVFTLIFTLRESPGHEGIMATDYRIQIAPPQAGASCVPPQPPVIQSGTAGELEEVRLTPLAGGWCRGTYSVTVFLQRGPYCPPPQEGAQTVPCPEFAPQDLETGWTGFTVGPAGPPPPMVTVPKLKGLKPRTANRRLRRHHLRVRYTGLSNVCAGVPPHGRIILQQPGPGTRVPRGTRVLVQTSCGS